MEQVTQVIFNVLAAAFPVILAITLHEAAHGRAALACGDSTAKALGRITLNPLKHIDPFGTILLPLILLILSKGTGGLVPIFGWAKPVPVNVGQLRNPLRDQFWVAGAGPAANALMLLGWLMIFWVQKYLEIYLFDGFFVKMAFFGIFTNLVLMLLNLLPVLPLDGGRILMSLLPRRMAFQFSMTERYGLIVILVLLFTNTLDKLFRPFFILVEGWL